MRVTAFILLVLLTVSGNASKPAMEVFVEEATQKFPSSRVLASSEITAIFNPVLQGEAQQMFNTVLASWERNQALNPYLPTSSSLRPSLTKGLRCFYVNAMMGLATENPADAQKGPIFQFLAAPKIPYKTTPYSYEDLSTVFLPILTTSSQELFKLGMSILLDPQVGTPKHTRTVLVEAYRCLYGKCVYALTLSKPDETQQEALFKLYAFPIHKGLIIAKYPKLADQIIMTPCEGCSKRAVAELPLYPFEVFENSSSSSSSSMPTE